MTSQAITPVHRLSAIRCAVTGAVLMAILFAACWVGTAIQGLPVTHAYIALFTPQPVTSVAALGEGLLWSVVFGAFAGALGAGVYNLFAFVGRR